MTGRAPGTGSFALQVLIRATSPECFEVIPLAGRDGEAMLAQLNDHLATPATAVQLTLPGHRGRPYAVTREAAAELLAKLEHAYRQGGNCVATVRGTFGRATSASIVGLG